MTQALRQLAEDFLSALLFFAIYAISGSLYAGVGIGIAAGLGRISWLTLIKRRSVDPMQWLSLALVIVFGGATILTHSPRLMMVKPSIVHFAIAAVMLRRGWLGRYLPPIALEHVPQQTIVAAGYAWAALLAAIAVANAIVAIECDLTTWAWFASFGAIGAKAAVFAVQYVLFRSIVRRRIIAARLAPAITGDAYRPMITE